MPAICSTSPRRTECIRKKPDLGVVELDGRKDHNVVFTSDMVVTSPTNRSYGPVVVHPTVAMTPQGKKAFFWGVNKQPPSARSVRQNATLLSPLCRTIAGGCIYIPPWDSLVRAPTPFWQTPHDVSGRGDDCLMHLMYDDAKQKWSTIYRRIIPEFSERMIADQTDRERPGVDRYNRRMPAPKVKTSRKRTNTIHISWQWIPTTQRIPNCTSSDVTSSGGLTSDT